MVNIKYILSDIYTNIHSICSSSYFQPIQDKINSFNNRPAELRPKNISDEDVPCVMLLCKFFYEKNLPYIKRYSFNPNKYPAINLKILNSDGISVTTCLIFRSGSVMITGGNDIREYCDIYKKFLKIINENDSILLS
jgi:hypothetical protein